MSPGTYLLIPTHTSICMHIHAYAYTYMHIHAHTLHPQLETAISQQPVSRSTRAKNRLNNRPFPTNCASLWHMERIHRDMAA